MLHDPVGITDIAKRANVRPDTVKKWIDRHDTFPKSEAKLAGGRIWDWPKVEHWLRMTGRIPTQFRYLENGGAIEVQQPADGAYGRDRWVTMAVFVGNSDTGWRAFPKPPLAALTDDPDGAAQRLLDGWESARITWVRDHPDEPMPAHLAGGFVDFDNA